MSEEKRNFIKKAEDFDKLVGLFKEMAEKSSNRISGDQIYGRTSKKT